MAPANLGLAARPRTQDQSATCNESCNKNKKPRYIRETLKTYGAAEVALTKLQGQVDQNRHPKTDITLGEAISRWLDIAKLEDTTRDRYEDLVRMYVGPVLGDLPAGKLDAELLESFYAVAALP